MSTETERRLNDMCNLSEVLIDKGIGLGEISGKVIARFEDGMSVEEIAEKTNISIDEVKKILKDKELI